MPGPLTFPARANEASLLGNSPPSAPPTAARHSPLPLRGERRGFAAVAILLVVSAAVQGVGDVLSTAALASSNGLRGVLLLWAVDAAISLAGISLFAPWLQRVRPRELAVAVALGFGIAIAAIWAGTRAPQAPAGWWIVLGIVNTLQSNLVVLAAWTLARDVFSETQAMRLFGPLNGIAYAGTLIGLGGVAMSAGRAGSAWLLPASAGLLALAALAVPLLTQPVAHLPPQAQAVSQRTLWRNPVVRWLGLLEMSNGLTWTVLSLVVVAALQAQASGMEALLRSYAELKLFGPVLLALIQITLAGPLLRWLGYGKVLLSTPVALLVGLLGLAVAPGLAAAWLATALLQIAFGAEGAASQATLLKVPAPLRPAAGAWTTGQLPQIGYLLACVALGVGEFVGSGLSASNTAIAQWLAGFGVATAFAGLFVWRRLHGALRGASVDAENA